MRLLWCSDAPWSGSGYGVQARHILPRLAALPEIGSQSNVAVFPWFGWQGAVQEIGGFRMYPHGGGDYGNDLIGLHSRDFAADVVVTVIDAWTQRETAAQVAPARWVSWCPVDSDPVPQMTVDALQGATPLVYSRWGCDQLARAGVTATYVPLGIDTQTFRPLGWSFDKRADVRRRLVGPGCEHLAVMVAANVGTPDRKAFVQQMRGWAAFAADKPGARLYCHADPLPHYGGLDLRAVVAALGIAERVTFADSYRYFNGYPATYVAAVYNAADVHLGASMAEGFGLPIAEANACGIPAVVTDFASMPEVLRYGIPVRPKDRWWAAGYGAWWAWPDSDGIADALQALYDAGARPKQAQIASRLTHADYGWETVVRDYWTPLIREWAA